MRAGLAVLILGVVLAGVAVWLYQRSAAFVATAVRVEGTVVELVPHRGSSGSGATRRTTTTYHPRVRFESDGTTYEFEDSAGSSPPAFQVGEAVTVLHAPGHPEDAMVDSWVGRYLAPLVVGLFALVGIITGLAVTWIGRPTPPPAGDTADWPTPTA